MRDPIGEGLWGSAIREIEPLDLALEEVAEKIRSWQRDHEGRVVVWGAASKGVIFSLRMARGGVLIAGAVDINAAKQGRYLPVTGLRVDSPADFLERAKSRCLVVVVNPKYFDEVNAFLDGRHETMAL